MTDWLIKTVILVSIIYDKDLKLRQNLENILLFIEHSFHYLQSICTKEEIEIYSSANLTHSNSQTHRIIVFGIYRV